VYADTYLILNRLPLIQIRYPWRGIGSGTGSGGREVGEGWVWGIHAGQMACEWPGTPPFLNKPKQRKASKLQSNCPQDAAWLLGFR